MKRNAATFLHLTYDSRLIREMICLNGGKHNLVRANIIPCHVLNNAARTCAVAHSFVFDDVLVLERFEDLDFPLEVPEVLGRAVLQLLHGHHLSCAVLQGVVPAQLHAAKVPLSGGHLTGLR